MTVSIARPNTQAQQIMKTIKTVFALAAAASGFSAHAQTQTTSAQLQLTGAIAQICTIAISPTAKASTLDIKNGESDAVVGTVTENCNGGAGYTVSIASQNNGQLRTVASDPNAPLANYSARYDDATGSLAASGLSATRATANFDRQRNLLVTVTPNAQAIAGSYSDSITFMIAAK